MNRPMGEVLPFPRPPDRPKPEYTEAELEDARQTVNRMMADGCTEEFAYEVAVQKMKIMRGGRRAD